MLAQEAAKWLCGYPVTTGRAIVYNGQTLTLHRSELARNPDCPSSHAPYENVVELPWRAAEHTAHQLLARARADLTAKAHLTPGQGEMVTDSADGDLSLELGRDFMLSLYCPECDEHQKVNRAWGKVLESEQCCPHCGAARSARVIRSLDEANEHGDRPLANLGVPPGEVLTVQTPKGLLFYELSADIAGWVS
jgi:adenylyltransferase/sulfurtransferase